MLVTVGVGGIHRAILWWDVSLLVTVGVGGIHRAILFGGMLACQLLWVSVGSIGPYSLVGC